MPHVVLKGPFSVEDIWMAFEPTEFTESGNVYKAEEAFLSTDKTTVLLRSLTVERGFKKTFLVRLFQKEGTVTISVSGITSVERSDGVKRLLGLFAWRILQAEPEAKIESTNIRDFLSDPKA